MRRSLSPMLRKELENLDKDPDSRKSAMRALKSFVKDLDSKAIPIFLQQVSETKQSSTSSGEYTISLYEVLSRVHGPKIIPQIDDIMSTIVKTLSMSSGAFALQQACAKVVPSIARYAIDPTTAEDKKRYIIHSLCNPLSNCLLGSQDNTSSGAALCLQALVESDNWRFASSEMVNEVCQRVAGALEKYSQTNSHMALVGALAKHNSLIVDAYARLLIRSGLQILHDGFAEANSQKQLSAIHMINSLMRCLDPKSIMSELDLVIKEMDKCQSQSHRMPFVTGAASEALQLAKRICAEKGPKSVRGTESATGLNCERRENTRRRILNSGDQSPFPTSPESHSINSSVGYNYNIESPYSTNHDHQGLDYDRSVNRKLWQKFENGGLDVSLKDGIFSSITRGSDVMSTENDDFSQNHGNDDENFTGFVQESTEIEEIRSNTPSPQRLNGCINIDDVKIFTTPRKLIRSLQEQDNFDSGCSDRPSRMFTSPKRSIAWIPGAMCGQCILSKGMQCENCNEEHDGTKHFHGSSESVSSTENAFTTNGDPSLSTEVAPGIDVGKKRINPARTIVCSLCVALFGALVCLLAMGNQDQRGVLVPT